MLLNMLDFVLKKAEAQSFIIDARASNRLFLDLPLGRCLQVKDFCNVEIQRFLEDAQNWFVGSADIKNAFHQIRILTWIHAFFALSAVLVSEVDYTGKTINQKRLAPDSLL